MPTYRELLSAGRRQLAAANIPTAELDARVLLGHVAGLDRTHLFLVLPDPAPDTIAAAYDAALDKRVAGDPVAYITGEREFMGLQFRVTPDVLTPRPETELLVEWALDRLQRWHFADEPLIVDVGTGSGAIAISITTLAKRPVCVIATDLSAAALQVAARNADALIPRERRGGLSFRQGSLLAPIVAPTDFVLANLPYLTPEQIADNPDLSAEPVLALHGGIDGLDLVRDLIADLPRILAPGTGVGLEIDPEQAKEVAAMLQGIASDGEIRILRDLSGFERHVVLEPGWS